MVGKELPSLDQSFAADEFSELAKLKRETNRASYQRSGLSRGYSEKLARADKVIE
jgi:hypothetical protein